MPTYQYTCTDCGERLEVVQKFSDEVLTICPACQGRLRKVFSAVGVVFKGSGFYRTDSRAASNGASGSSKESSKESSSASDSGSSATTKDGSSNGKADTGAGKSSTNATSTS